jgi:hypothetical protein
MRVNDDYPAWNAEAQVTNPASVFWYWQNLLKLRRLYTDVFVYGSFELVDRDHKDVFCYRRAHGEGYAIVVLNFSSGNVQWTVPELLVSFLSRQGPLVHNYADSRCVNDGRLSLRSFEALVWVEEGSKTHL